MFNNKGIAMLIVISLILMLLILGGAAIIISTSHSVSTTHQIRRTRAYYAAEAAMQHALWSLRTNDALLPGPGTMTNIIFPENINGINQADITIVVEDENTPAETPPGVHPIRITVTY